ncbi:hypothetical protein BRADI_2g61763v3 [Brachypodium distachyon]|uniref:KIB1-4 beta-propeller domain-containing protein n=1 Tax=Brachypodium distachyon TaxID=15368 RepID=A0A0Q3GKU6_BRADI|nr:hypothetical protein BRADI_2g61763v3 [Brachypodium distachyon]
MEVASWSSAPAWSDLPPELVGWVITRLPASADCARLRAACRSLHSAMRSHGTPPRQPPSWLVLPAANACFPASTHGRPVSFPEKTRCVGSTGSWLILALDAVPAAAAHRRSHCLHNPFTGTTVPLPELGAAMDAVPEKKKKMKIRKMLVRSSGHRVVVIAVMTGDPSYPIVLSRPGKDAWLYKAHTDLLTSIVDIAFLGDRLYGVTRAEELFSINAAFHDDDDVVGSLEAVGEDGECIDDVSADVEEESNVDDEDGNMVLDGMDRDDDDGDMVLKTCHHFVDGDEDTSSPLESMGLDIINWYIVESCGKLLMVKPQLQCPKGHVEFTRKVDVSELDVSAGVGLWVPVVGGLGGQALFISRSFCKSVRAGGEIEEDAIYFIDRGDVFSMISQTSRAAQWDLTRGIPTWETPTWIFPPDLVV